MGQGFGYENTTRRVEIFLFKPAGLDLACGGRGLSCDKTNFNGNGRVEGKTDG